MNRAECLGRKIYEDVGELSFFITLSCVHGSGEEDSSISLFEKTFLSKAYAYVTRFITRIVNMA